LLFILFFPLELPELLLREYQMPKINYWIFQFIHAGLHQQIKEQ